MNRLLFHSFRPAGLFRILCVVSLALTVAPLPAQQEGIPKLINYQGRLVNAAGQAYPGGIYSLRVTIHSRSAPEAVGDTLVWGRDFQQIQVIDGQFNLLLGDAGGAPVAGAAVNNLGFAFSGDRYLQLTLLTGSGGAVLPAPQPLLPRQQLTSVPYALNGVPPGTVVPFAGSVVPDGWVLCDGTAYSASNARFSSLGLSLQGIYGNDGEGTFRVPDLRGRVPVGAGQGEGLSQRLLGELTGSEIHTLTLAQMPPHQHGGNTSISGEHTHGTAGNSASDDGGSSDSHFALGDSNAGRGWPGITIHSSGSHSHNIGIDGGGEAHNIMQPSIILNYIIKL